MSSKPPYTVIGYYVPSWYSARLIGEHLTALTKNRGLVPHCDPVHGPEPRALWKSVPLHAQVRRTSVAGSQGEGWHQDGDLKPGSSMDCALVLWCNTVHTQFRGPDGIIWQPKPFELVIARNLGCFHRKPPNAPARRWTFRQRVRVPENMYA